jgi:hypothetical protein
MLDTFLDLGMGDLDVMVETYATVFTNKSVEIASFHRLTNESEMATKLKEVIRSNGNTFY